MQRANSSKPSCFIGLFQKGQNVTRPSVADDKQCSELIRNCDEYTNAASMLHVVFVLGYPRRWWPRPQNTHFSHPPIPRDLYYSVQALSETVHPSVESKQSAWKTSGKWVPLEFLKYLFNGLRSEVEPQRIWNFHIILHPSWLHYWSFRSKLDFSLNSTGIQNCRWRHVQQRLGYPTR